VPGRPEHPLAECCIIPLAECCIIQLLVRALRMLQSSQKVVPWWGHEAICLIMEMGDLLLHHECSNLFRIEHRGRG